MKATHEPLKRTPVVLRLDADGSETAPVLTNRAGVARFDLPPTSGKVLVSGLERYDGRLDGEIPIELWSILETEHDSRGLPGEFPNGSNAYPSMTTRWLKVGERQILTDGEGYLVDPADWPEDFARALAAHEGLSLTAEHWELIRFLRARFARHGSQATVRDMIQHFRHPPWFGLPAFTALPPRGALHALTVSAIGVVSLGMMSRVTLGHTGRPMRATPLLILAFVLINAAALGALGPLLMPAGYHSWLMAGGLCWILAFGIFLWVHAPMLWRSRVDGRP